MTNTPEIHLDLLVSLKAVHNAAPGTLISWHLLDVVPFGAATSPDLDNHIIKARLTLHRSETEAYLYNLQSPEPSLFLVIRTDENAAPEIHLATVSPYEAQDYMDGDEEQVERIVMTDDMLHWLHDFIAANDKKEPFKKRRRDAKKTDDEKFGKTPIFLSDKDRLKL